PILLRKTFSGRIQLVDLLPIGGRSRWSRLHGALLSCVGALGESSRPGGVLVAPGSSVVHPRCDYVPAPLLGARSSVPGSGIGRCAPGLWSSLVESSDSSAALAA